MRLLLMMNANRLTNEGDIIDQLRSKGFSVQVKRNVCSFIQMLDDLCEPAVAVVWMGGDSEIASYQRKLL